MNDIEKLEAFLVAHKHKGEDMTELDKLESYLKEHGFYYERIDQNYYGDIGRHQIVVYDESGERQWDAICQYGSYGHDEGLLEIMGNIVDETIYEDYVEGWLTAEEIIKRL